MRTTSASAASPRELATHCQANPIGFSDSAIPALLALFDVSTTTGVVRAVLAFTGRSAQRTLRVWVIRRHLSIGRWSLVPRNRNPSRVCRPLE